ncbi:MAG: cation acetate symporter [Vicinamibacterales bacterium]|jgi:cation/acetate symporter|nr:cation acetate symporter [Vicinamibacterales bacterium]
MTSSLLMFLAFIAVTLGITYWASKRTKTAAEFYSAGRSITGFQNGWAVAGDYMSAASFLGIAGLIAFNGYDGFLYSVGWLVAYLTVLLVVAEPLRNTGKFTMADVLAFRLRHRSVRTVAACSTLTVSLLYMIAQMVGAGSLVSLLIPQISFNAAIVLVGALMLIYVIFGGMLATTWVQIIKAVLLMAGTILLSVLVMSRFDFSMLEFFEAVSQVTGSVKDAAGNTIVKDFTQPGLRYHGTWGALDLISLGVALIFGTAGLPHILIRFYTVPSAQQARQSVVWAMILIGAFYVMTTFLGFGAATLVGNQQIGVRVKDVAANCASLSPADLAASTDCAATRAVAAATAADAARGQQLASQLAEHGYVVPAANTNLAAPLLAEELGGEIMLSFVAAIAFATILAVVAGLTIAASTAFAHDIWLNVVKHGKGDEREQVLVARITAGVIGLLSILLAIALKSLNVAFLVGLAFAVAASANVPSIVLTLFWRRFNSTGMITGMVTGLVSSLVLIALSPAVMGVDPPTAAVRHLIQAPAIFPLENPGILSVPLGFLGAWLGTIFSREEAAEEKYAELTVRANTGLGAEV